MEHQYEVTIGIPVYRAEKYIRQAMESALSQTFFSIEFLIIDDAGNDASMDIIGEFQRSHPRGKDIRVIQHQENLGVGAARNHILDEAHGRCLYFMDADDTISPNTIELLMGKKNACQAEIVYGSYQKIENFTQEKQVIAFQYPDVDLLELDQLATFVFSHCGTFQVSVCNCLIDLNFLRNTGIRFLDSMFWEDMAFTFEMVINVRRAALLSEITYNYNCHPDSLSNYQDRAVINKEEVLQNVATVEHVKHLCREVVEKPYAPFLCYNVVMYSFYIVCYIMKHEKRIYPKVSVKEMYRMMTFPVPVMEVWKFRHKQVVNLLLWLIVHLPIPLWRGVVYIMGKSKNVL